MEIINRLTSSLQVRPFDFIRKADPAQLMNFLQNENSQTIALIMTYLNPEQSASLLSSLPPEKQVGIARRVATMDRTSPDVIKEVEKVLESAKWLGGYRRLCKMWEESRLLLIY